MKKWIAILLCTLGLLGILALCPPPPEKPTCPLPKDPLATITVAPATWHDAVVGHYETREYIDPVYSCPVIEWTYGGRTINVPYDKSSDPNKCHRPSDSTLMNHPCHMGNNERSAFKAVHSEWLDSTLVTAGYYTDWTDAGYQRHCSQHPTTCRYIEAVDGYWIDPVCKAPDAPPPTDVCPNLEGVQETVPEGLELRDGECLPPIIPPPPPKHCKVQGDIWYECKTGAWLYGTGLLRDCTWCGGLTGRRVVRESYDCGAHYTWYDYGERVDDPPQDLGRYPCPGNCK